MLYNKLLQLDMAFNKPDHIPHFADHILGVRSEMFHLQLF